MESAQALSLAEVGVGELEGRQDGLSGDAPDAAGAGVFEALAFGLTAVAVSGDARQAARASARIRGGFGGQLWAPVSDRVPSSTSRSCERAVMPSLGKTR